MDLGVVIVGGGHAGTQVAFSLRDEGYEGAITLLSDEAHYPYQRPPLSKGFLKGDPAALLRPLPLYQRRKVDLRLEHLVTSIDRVARRVLLGSGQSMPYEHLILATGCRPRNAQFPGSDLDGVFTLGDLASATLVRERLESVHNVVIIGAGFIGLEFAATAASKGLSVFVVEAADRVMRRAVSHQMSSVFAAAHRDNGVQIHLNAGVASINGGDKVVSVSLANGITLPADLVLVAIGVQPEDLLAQQCGLTVANGIVVDDSMTTSDPNVSAIGDCANHPNIHSRSRTRLESVQNAVDQAKVVARKLTGKESRYHEVPWFWSDQYDLKLQIAGLMVQVDEFVVRGEQAANRFSIFGFSNGELRAVESVNNTFEHMWARKALSHGAKVTSDQVSDPQFELRASNV